MVKAVTRDMVSVMRPFPPRDRDSGYTVTGKKLDEFITRLRRCHVVMTRVMSDVSALYPEEAEQDRGDKVSPDAGACNNTVNNRREHHRDARERVESHVTFFVEEAAFGELGG